MKFLILLVTALYTTVTFGDGNSAAPVPGEGAFVTLMVKAQDPASYIEMLKKNPAPFEAICSSVAGACVTKTGADYPWQMFILNAFGSV